MTTDELTAEVQRLRGVLARIESLVWYQPDDDDDLVEAVRAMARERDEALQVALANSDACWKLEQEMYIRQRDEARAEVERLRREHDHERKVANEQLARAHDAVRERDEARAEVERLRAALAQAQRADE